MTNALVLIALLAAETSARPAPVPPPGSSARRPEGSPAARPAHRGTGEVEYATAAHAYLDAGAEDGLAVGAEIALRRGPEAIGTCKVESVAPHHAACAFARARVGDTFALPPAPAGEAPLRLLPPPVPADVLAHRRSVVEAAPVPLVAFQVNASEPLPMPRTRAIDVSLTQQSWDASQGGASSKESLDVLARGVPLSSWLFLDLDARVEHWSARQAARFRPHDETQLYVWQAQLTAVPNDTLSLSAGRVLPWGVPGATVFDGGLLSWHGGLFGARAETGLFAGTVPQPDTLALTSTRATGGAYWILDRELAFATVRTEGRLAAVRSPELGTRAEATLTGRLFKPTLDLSLEAGLGAGGKEHAPGYLDAARLDATYRPIPHLDLGGSLRYAGLDWPQNQDPPAEPGRSREGEGFVNYGVVRWLRLGALGGVAEDLSSRAIRRWLGPEVTLPQLLFGWGTFSGGFLWERGWLSGQSAYGQLTATPIRRLWLLLRAAWSHENVSGTFQDEGSLTLGARAELNQFLALRLTLTGRTALDVAGQSGRPQGLSAFATLQAGF